MERFGPASGIKALSIATVHSKSRMKKFIEFKDDYFEKQ